MGFGGSWLVTELTVARQDKFLVGPQTGNSALSQWPLVTGWEHVGPVAGEMAWRCLGMVCLAWHGGGGVQDGHGHLGYMWLPQGHGDFCVHFREMQPSWVGGRRGSGSAHGGQAHSRGEKGTC